MTHPIKHIDISNYPDLMRLAVEVRETKEPRMLVSDHEAVAILMPAGASLKKRAKRHPKGKTRADYEAFKAAAGGWKGLIDEETMEEIIRSRSVSTNPPLEL